MISRTHRFHGYGSLRYTYARGSTVHGQYSSLRFAQNRRRQTFRAAVVVSRKVNKSAVVRNRIRRRIYEIIRNNVLPSAPYDLIVTVFSDQVSTFPADKLQRLIVEKLNQAHIARRPKTASPTTRHGIVDAKERS